MSETRLSQVLDKNLFLQCQILLPHLDKQVDRQEARQFFRPKSGGAFNKVVPDVELLNLKNAKLFFFVFVFNRGDTVSRRSPIKGVRPSPYTTLCS